MDRPRPAANVSGLTGASSAVAGAGALAGAGAPASPKDAAKVAAASDAVASAERTPSELSSKASLPSKPLAKASPVAAGGKGTLQSIPMQSARVGMGTPEQEARHAEIHRKLETARGDERKALLMEQCELEASLQRGPDAVLSCSKVTREFPGTPEAKRAAEIARGFSLQLPSDAPER